MFSKACGAQPPSRIFFSIGPVFGTAHSHLFRVQGFRTLNTRASLSESNHGLAHRQNYLIAYRTLANRSNAISRDNEAQNAISEKEAVNPRIKSVLRTLRMLPADMEVPTFLQSFKAKPGFNRWLLLPFGIFSMLASICILSRLLFSLLRKTAVSNYVCLGSVFAWSIFNQPLTRLDGVVVQASSDWLLSDISLTFSLIMGGFAWGAVFSTYLDKLGPRASCTLGGLCLGSGYSLISLAVVNHNLPLLYLGGTIWGMANGWAYVPPVTTMFKWFPDRKGMASGACIVGYGGGAALAAPLFGRMLDHFQVKPEFLGPKETVDLIHKEGLNFVQRGNEMVEVVVAAAKDASVMGLEEGVYVVGSGSTGAAETFATLGLGYGLTMIACSYALRFPSSISAPNASTDIVKGSPLPNTPAAPNPVAITQFNVDPKTALHTPQFWIMYAGFGTSITGTYGLLSTGKTMFADVVTPAFPALAAAASTFVVGMSVSNLGGRLFYSTLSDILVKWTGKDSFFGRQHAFSVMWSVGPVCYLSCIWAIHAMHEQGASEVPFYVFCGSIFGIIASFGGTTATRPALANDLFGDKSVSVITARQLSVVLPAAVVGPQVAVFFKSGATNSAMAELASKITDHDFYQAFGETKDMLPLLIEQHTVTINRLMEIVPVGTIDPTPFMYDNALYVGAGLQAIALLMNLSMSPVDKKYHEDTSPPPTPPASQQKSTAPPPPPPSHS